ncbi:uncharacterized protein [Neodiprion pinetum]|uniref:uncharacterized protein n=1 Tax=Neodiprion pinetum TaxID=441929 RepID=UPI001EE0D57D|nr:uncharacterized protein LOC124211188 [Neodiprion pinetum]XP_046465967.1 uncharacterized protein LOC124211188 [Neodiprion pinetum]
MQVYLGFWFVMTVLVVHGCIDQCEKLNSTEDDRSFTLIESQEEKKAARLIYKKMMVYDLLQPRDTLIKLSPPARFMPSSIFVKRCFPIDRKSGSLVVQTANITRKIPVKRLVSKKWVFYNVNVVEHIKCGYVPI